MWVGDGWLMMGVWGVVVELRCVAGVVLCFLGESRCCGIEVWGWSAVVWWGGRGIVRGGVELKVGAAKRGVGREGTCRCRARLLADTAHRGSCALGGGVLSGIHDICRYRIPPLSSS